MMLDRGPWSSEYDLDDIGLIRGSYSSSSEADWPAYHGACESCGKDDDLNSRYDSDHNQVFICETCTEGWDAAPQR